MTDNTIYTIGHSTHSQQTFLRLLQQHSIEVVADVRSVPYSEFNPQYNTDTVKKFLQQHAIQYVFLGTEFGARTENSECYVQGRVQYEKIANTQDFKNGVRRIQKGIKCYKIALMCSEKDPIDCHRTILVSRYLIEKLAINAMHILANGDLKSQQEVLKSLVNPNNDFFHTVEQQVEEAYKKQESVIAYRQH